MSSRLNLTPDSATPPTIHRALRSSASALAGSSDTPSLDVEVLLMHAIGRDRAYLRAWPERVLAPEAAERFRVLLERRMQGWPIAYLTGEREFWSRSFAVRPGVLIPRPETELLVELALDLLPPTEPAEVLDLGTGSGIIAITLAAERSRIRVTATDLSREALAVARDNALRHGTANVRFVEGDWFAALPADSRFDLIVGNPPYVAEQDPHLLRGDLRFEPELALNGGPSGLDALGLIAGQAGPWLQPHGHLLLEHGHDQADALAQRLAECGYRDIVHHRDLRGHCRATSGLRPCPK